MTTAKQIIITLPKNLDDAGIKDYLEENLDEIWGALDLELEDDRADVDEVTVDEIELFEDAVHIHYCVQYSAYYGCKDMNYVDDDVRCVSGARTGLIIVFDTFVPPELRSTYEEF